MSSILSIMGTKRAPKIFFPAGDQKDVQQEEKVSIFSSARAMGEVQDMGNQLTRVFFFFSRRRKNCPLFSSVGAKGEIQEKRSSSPAGRRRLDFSLTGGKILVQKFLQKVLVLDKASNNFSRWKEVMSSRRRRRCLGVSPAVGIRDVQSWGFFSQQENKETSG